MKLIITYPQIVFETKVIEIKDDHYEELQDASLREQAAFVYNHLSEVEQNWIPNGEEGLKSAIDVGYCPPPKPVLEKCLSTTTIITPSGRLSRVPF